MASQAHLYPAFDAPASVSHVRLAHIGWFGAGVIGGFLVPFIFSSVLGLHHDLYYLIYFTLAGGSLGHYVRRNAIDVGQFLRASIWPSLIIGVPVTLFLIFNVLSRDGTKQ